MKLRALVVAVALAASACAGGDGDASETTTSTPTTATDTTTEVTEATTATTTTLATTTTAPVSSIVWSRVPHDEAVFAGEEDQIMQSVTSGGPGLVAVGWDVSARVGAVWTSADGTSWTRVPHDEAVFGGQGDQFIVSVTAGGPGLVAVGAHVTGLDRFTAVWTSPDGITWSRVPHGQVFAGNEDWQFMSSVTSGGPGLVAVGWDGFEDRDAAVWTSPDGFTWTRVPHDVAVFGGEGNQEMLSVTVGGPGLVAVGREGDLLLEDRNAAVWTSADGATWTRVPHDETVFGGENWQEMLSVTAGGPGLVAIGSDMGLGAQAAWTSADGTNWSRAPHDEEVFGEGVLQMWAVTAGGPGLVAVGYEFSGGAEGDRDAAVWTSNDGITWFRVPHDEAVLGGEDNQEMLSVTVGGSGLVAVGTDGQIFPGDLDGAVWVMEG